jgi:PAS domain S-box-containing protein
LIVEDRATDAELVVDQLREAGFDPVWERVQTETDYLARLSPDLDVILSDHRMPQFDSTTALRLLQETGLDIPFILVSGTIGEELAVSAMKQGAADYLLKDRLTRLGAAVRQAIRQKQLRDERRQAEIALREREERFRALLEHGSDIIAVTDADGAIRYISPSVTRVLGYTPDEMSGNKSFAYIHPDDLEKAVTSHQALAAEPGDTSSNEWRIQHKNGSWRVLEVILGNQLANPSVEGLVINARDITERKQTEAELLQAEILRAELEKEKELIELRERFISMVSHDFRTPLTVLQFSSELLSKYYERITPEQRHKAFHDIDSQIKYMHEMLDEVLIVDRARSGELKPQITRIDLVPFCQDILEQIQLTDKIGHQFVLTHNGVFNETATDPNLLRRILVNLLSNAVKYSPNGGEIQFEISGQLDEIVFRISDQGIGIPAADRERIFEVFHRGSNAQAITGTGLGLAIVKSSITALGGTINCESKDGEGTTFWIHLPL